MDSHSPRAPRLTADDPLAPLAHWLAEGRVEAASEARARQRWLERQAAEEATIAGVLLDLAERSRPIVVRTKGAHTAQGTITAVGTDFVAVRVARLGELLVPLTSIATLRTVPGESPVVGARPLSFVIVFAEALVEMAADRPEVLVSTGNEEIRGSLRSAGRDLISVTSTAEGRPVVQIASGAIDHLLVLGR